MQQNGLFKIGEVYAMQFDGTGSVQTGLRPGLVFQNNIGNKYSPNLIALPLTSALKKANLPTHVFVSAEGSGLYKDSMILCENPVCISKEQVGRYITTLTDETMQRVAVASILATSAIALLPRDSLDEVWLRAVALNNSAA